MTGTNTLTAAIAVAVNGLLGVAIAFDVAMTSAQLGAINLAVNGLLALAVIVNSMRARPARA
jgi:hypothetical protein